MDKDIFTEMFGKLDDRFRARKRTPPEEGQIYYDALKHLPNEPFKEIINGFIMSGRSFPTPDEVIKSWLDWQRQNPERMLSDQDDDTYCEECFGTGSIDFWYVPKEWKRIITIDEAVKQIMEGASPHQISGLYLSAARCARCSNWKRSLNNKQVMGTREQLRKRGVYVPHRDGEILAAYRKDNTKEKRDVETEAAKVGRGL